MTTVDEVLSRFPDARELYSKDPIFHSIVNMIANGQSPYTFLEQIYKQDYHRREAEKQAMINKSFGM